MLISTGCFVTAKDGNLRGHHTNAPRAARGLAFEAWDGFHHLLQGSRIPGSIIARTSSTHSSIERNEVSRVSAGFSGVS